jgi:hypothetical protein
MATDPRPSSATLWTDAVGGARLLPAPLTHVPSPAVSVLASAAPDVLTAEFTRLLFGSSPVVVVARDAATLAAAEKAAWAAHAPLLIAAPAAAARRQDATPSTHRSATTATPPGATPVPRGPAATTPSPSPGATAGPRRSATTTRSPGATASPHPAAQVSAALVAGIMSLHPRAVLAVGLPAWALAARLPGIQVVSSAARLPAIRAPVPLRGVAVLVRSGPASGAAAAAGAAGPALAALRTTAADAGATVVGVHGDDPRGDPAAIKILAHLRPRAVVGIGSGFGPGARLAARVAVAMTGVQLPGGGEVVFPGRRLVALYGHPGTPGLGVLGRQDLTASIARARRVAAAYRPLSRVPVVPAFEIIATVALSKPGPDGDYSNESDVSSLRPWVLDATAAGMYIVLDLQPGRASLLAQAKRYQSLLTLPNVGLALDPEWKLGPDQRPLRQIGSVSIGEVNSVVRWLAALTARHHLPQKLLVLHQFRLSMIAGEKQLDTGHDDLAIVIHMDGQGTPAAKQDTWNAVTPAAPAGIFFGWKNFLVKDHPMLSPRETMSKTPTPVMISYQ